MITLLKTNLVPSSLSVFFGFFLQTSMIENWECPGVKANCTVISQGGTLHRRLYSHLRPGSK